MEPSDRCGLDSDQLRSSLAGQLIGSKIVLLSEVTSTNDEAWQHGQKGEPEGTVFFAENQTAGRGQRGNRWESKAGTALLLSILLKPGLTPAESPGLTEWAAAAVVGTIRESSGLPARIKPPNDVMIADRKIAGILVEMRAQAGEPHLAIVGIGVNLNQTPADFSPALRSTATSLRISTGVKVNRDAFAVALLRELNRTYGRALDPKL